MAWQDLAYRDLGGTRGISKNRLKRIGGCVIGRQSRNGSKISVKIAGTHRQLSVDRQCPEMQKVCQDFRCEHVWRIAVLKSY